MKYFHYIILAALLLSCGNDDGKTYTVEDIDGVRHVHNTASVWGDEQKIELEFIQKIGELESEDENYQFFTPMDVIVDKEDNIYVLDSGNTRIQKFDKKGKFITTIGRKGEGPGEFIVSNNFQIVEEEFIYVNDPGNSRISLFNREGKFIKTILNGKSLNEFLVLNSGEIVFFGYTSIAIPKIMGEQNIPDKIGFPLIALFDEKGTLVKEIGEAQNHGDFNFTIYFNNIKFTSDAENNIYCAYLCQNRIDKYSSEGQYLWRADRKLPIEENLEDHWAYFNYFSNNIQIDSKGRIWTTTYLKEESLIKYGEDAETENQFTYEIFDSDGILLIRLPYTEIFIPIIKIFGDRLFTIDRMYSMAVYEYRIVEK
ncbi:6-bladed beta-propeller [candidate division KSB1 bacterium]